ncbi:MAG TPA: response regulator [Candidatus Binatia bacterium]|nr:response regulator [Candidatus Binatia bacterium]
MKIVRLRCNTCGNRSEVALGGMETHDLRGQKSVHRFCRICRGSTQHEVIPSDGARIESAEGFQDAFQEEINAPRALVIEDDQDSRTVLAKALAAAHFDVVCVGDGQEALSILAREEFAVILSDIRMPGLDGRRLFQFLDQNLPEARARVIFITGDTGNPETRDFLEATGQPYLPKPVELPLLFVLLESIREGAA